jgi:hypothetical protein
MASGRMLQSKISQSHDGCPFGDTPYSGVTKPAMPFLFLCDEPDDGVSHVYFMRMGEMDPIKIGYTKRIRVRMRLIRYELRAVRMPLTLLATFPGGNAEERELHKRFASDRLWREWFRSSPDLLAVVEAHRG